MFESVCLPCIPFPPTSLYDIHPGEFVHPNYADQFNGHFSTGSVEPCYSEHLSDGMLAPTFQDPYGAIYYQARDGRILDHALQPNGYTFAGGLAPTQVSPLSGNTPSSSSLSSSFEATLTLPPGPSSGNIPQLYPEILEDNTPPLSITAHARPRRTRGPNKRLPGTGFLDLLVRFISYLVSETSPNFERKTLSLAHCRRSSRGMSELQWKRIILPVAGIRHPQRRARGRRRRTLRGKSTSSRTSTAKVWARRYESSFPISSARPLSPITTYAREPSKISIVSFFFFFFSFLAGPFRPSLTLYFLFSGRGGMTPRNGISKTASDFMRSARRTRCIRSRSPKGCTRRS